MWFIAGGVLLLYVAYSSGEHHGERALRIVKANRPERSRKWRVQEAKIRQLEALNKELRKLVRSR